MPTGSLRSVGAPPLPFCPNWRAEELERIVAVELSVAILVLELATATPFLDEVAILVELHDLVVPGIGDEHRPVIRDGQRPGLVDLRGGAEATEAGDGGAI